MAEDWFWEGNIVEALCKHLVREGWSMEHIAHTRMGEGGIGVLARKDNRQLMTEVRGYPSSLYQRGPKIGQRKPTSPKTMARHWFSAVLLAAILRQSEQPGDIVAIALPDFVVYHTLIEQTQHALDRLGIFVFIIEQTSRVSIITPADSVPL